MHDEPMQRMQDEWQDCPKVKRGGEERGEERKERRERERGERERREGAKKGENKGIEG